MEDNQQHAALADVYTLAQLLHSLRGLTDEVEDLLADSMTAARDAKVKQILIAEAAAVSPSRVSQIVKGRQVRLRKSQI